MTNNRIHPLPAELWALDRARIATQNMYAVRGFLPLRSKIVLEILRGMEKQIQNTIRLVEGDPKVDIALE